MGKAVRILAHVAVWHESHPHRGLSDAALCDVVGWYRFPADHHRACHAGGGAGYRRQFERGVLCDAARALATLLPRARRTSAAARPSARTRGTGVSVSVVLSVDPDCG